MQNKTLPDRRHFCEPILSNEADATAAAWAQLPQEHGYTVNLARFAPPGTAPGDAKVVGAITFLCILAQGLLDGWVLQTLSSSGWLGLARKLGIAKRTMLAEVIGRRLRSFLFYFAAFLLFSSYVFKKGKGGRDIWTYCRTHAMPVPGEVALSYWTPWGFLLDSDVSACLVMKC